MAVHVKKHILQVRPETIPQELKSRPQWVVWKAVGEKPDKRPYSACTGQMASSTDLLTWSTFEEACKALESGQYSGLGFVLCSGDPYTGVDLDDCIDPETGEIAAWALEIIRNLNSYTELSVSGTGVHIIVRGDVPNRRKDKIEVYSSKRFFTMSGHSLELGGD